jgi:hypothetical protein
MKIETFVFEAETLKPKFIETMVVKEGVECDVYGFEGDTSKDLGIVRVKKGHKTPLQRVLKAQGL